MRRTDREMDAEFALSLIDCSAYGVLSMIHTDGTPYGIPLSLVRKGDSLYFHSAKDGKKVDIFTQNSKVSISFVGSTKIPELYTEAQLEELKSDPKAANELTRRVFTTEFESTIVFGNISLVESDQEKMEALRIICQKYTPMKMELFEMAARPALSKTAIYRVDINEISGKRKKFDHAGEEMKWGRME